MDVLLLKPVSKLGLPGDIRSVARGYARNYLLPQQYAVAANDPLAKEIRADLAQARESAVKEQQTLKEQAKQWNGKAVTIPRKATTDGTLFGAVTERDVAKELGVDRKQVKFTPAKTVGTYDARLDLGQGVDVSVSVHVKAARK